MVANTFMVTLDIRDRPVQAYSTLMDLMRRQEESVDVSDTAFIVRTQLSGEQLLSEIKKHIDLDDFVVVAQVQGFLGGLGGDVGRPMYHRDRIVRLRGEEFGIYGPGQTSVFSD